MNNMFYKSILLLQCLGCQSKMSPSNKTINLDTKHGRWIWSFYVFTSVWHRL